MPEMPFGVSKSRSGAQVYGWPDAIGSVSRVVPSPLLSL
jgi:hypothetical protein